MQSGHVQQIFFDIKKKKRFYSRMTLHSKNSIYEFQKYLCRFTTN